MPNNIAMHITNLFLKGGDYIAKEGDIRKWKSGTYQKKDHSWHKIPSLEVVRYISHVKDIMNHPLHKEAKKGDALAGIKIIEDFYNKSEEKFNSLTSFLKTSFPNAKILPIFKKEKLTNTIALSLANKLSILSNLDVCTDINQIKQEKGKTTLSGLQRFKNKSQYEGEVEKGQQYILVDDVFTTGGSLSEMKSYIEEKGGKVVEIVTLVRAKGTSFNLTKEVDEELKGKFDIEGLNQLLVEQKIVKNSYKELTNEQIRKIIGPKSQKDFSIQTLRKKLTEGKIV